MINLSYCATIDELLDMWKHEFSDSIEIFIKDGIICEEEYSNPHILFVMRDTNVSKEVDVREDLREWGSGWKTWNNAARWAVALLTGNIDYPLEIDRRAEMRKVAVINIKKKSGGARAYKEELQEAAKQYGNFSLREIELCDPSIIICGGFGNADILKDYVFGELASEWKKLPAIHFAATWWYYFATINGKQIPVISFCHPQVCNFKGKRGHKELFEPLYREMLNFRQVFLHK